MRYLLVANPTAQSGKNAARVARARELLDHARLDHRFVPTAPAGGTVDTVKRELLADTSIDAVIAMGGDGTFAEVAKGLWQSGRSKAVRLAMLPTGTANDQGKSFGLLADESSLEANVAVIAEGHETRLDAGEIRVFDVNEKLVREDMFFDSAGWGLSPRVLHLRNEDREIIAGIPVVRDIYRDHLVYAGALMRTFLASYIDDDKFDARLLADGKERHWHGLTDLVVKGTRIYGGMWVFDSTSKHDDGLFEVVPFAGRRDWLSKAMVHLDQTGAMSESLARVGVTHSEGMRGKEIELWLSAHEGGPTLAGQIDGEEFPAGVHIKIHVLQQVLRLVVPKIYADVGTK
jgi:diacylglycerol kinase family enzyme